METAANKVMKRIPHCQGFKTSPPIIGNFKGMITDAADRHWEKVTKFIYLNQLINLDPLHKGQSIVKDTYQREFQNISHA